MLVIFWSNLNNAFTVKSNAVNVTGPVKILYIKHHTHAESSVSAQCLLKKKKKQKDLPGGSDCKASADSAEDPGLISGSGRSPGEGNGNPLQYSCHPPQKRGSK